MAYSLLVWWANVLEWLPEEVIVQKYCVGLSRMILGGLLLCSVSLSTMKGQVPSKDKSNSSDASQVAKDPNKNGAPAPPKDAASTPAQLDPLSGYRVGPEDELTIAVWHEPELSQNVTVRPDGMITLPLLNDIKVAGLTTQEMQVLLTDKLKTVVNDPQVTVSVKAVRSKKVFLVGNVAKQGVYPLDSNKTVMELLVEAGGLGPFAKKGSIYVLRTENGKQTRIPFDYKKAVAGKGSLIELKPGDMVVVP